MKQPLNSEIKRLFVVGLNHLRKKSGIKQKDIAEATGISHSQISAMVTGNDERAMPNLAKWDAIAAVFDKTALEIIDLARDMESRKVVNLHSAGKKQRPISTIEAEHLATIRQFIDKELALSLNRHLVDLEKTNPAAYERIATIIERASYMHSTVGEPPAYYSGPDEPVSTYYEIEDQMSQLWKKIGKLTNDNAELRSTLNAIKDKIDSQTTPNTKVKEEKAENDTSASNTTERNTKI